ncbi:hypothetical protein [Streptomyces phaeochromogenes]
MKTAGRFVYWSDRLIEEVTDSNGVRLDSPVKSAVKLGVGGVGLELSGQDREKKTSFEIAKKVMRKLGNDLVSDLDTLGPLRFVRGEGTVEVAKFQWWGYTGDPEVLRETCVVHARTVSKRGRRVDLCLFGSIKNLRGYVTTEDEVEGWTSSAAPAIGELISSRGATNSDGYDDESLAVEALKIALYQGIYTNESEHEGRPETRAFTIGGADSCEYAALIYKDVALTRSRWNHDLDMRGADRILIGAPIWVRTSQPETIRHYFGANRIVLPGR